MGWSQHSRVPVAQAHHSQERPDGRGKEPSRQDATQEALSGPDRKNVLVEFELEAGFPEGRGTSLHQSFRQLLF